MPALSSMSLGQLMLHFAGAWLGEEGENQDGDTRMVREIREARKWVSQEVKWPLKVKAEDMFDIYCNWRRKLTGISPDPGKSVWRGDN